MGAGTARALLDRPVAVGVAGAAVCALGFLSFPLIPIDVSEEVGESPRLTVSVSWPDASAREIEARITAPLEALVQGVRGVMELSSTTSHGSAFVTADFVRDADLQLAELELRERIYSFFRERPEGVSWPRVRRSQPDLLREIQGFIRFHVLGSGSPTDLRKLVEEEVRLPLQAVPGVREVTARGGGEESIRIEMDRARARRFRIGLAAVRAALATHGMQTRSLGAAESHGIRTRIEVPGGIEDLDALRRIPLKRLQEGRVLSLGDVATVRYRSGDPEVLYRINGRNAVAVQVEKAYGSDMTATSRRVREKLAALSARLPHGTEVVVLNDEGAEVEADLRFLLRRAVFSVLLISLVLLAVFRRREAVLLILSSVALAATGAMSLFFLFGMRLDLVTLAGFTLGFGLIVDNAVVVYDYVHRRAEGCVRDGDLKEAVAAGLSEVTHPIAVSNLTTLGAFLPVLFLSEELQRYFKSFALSLGLTLAIALIVSLTLIPVFFYRTALRRPRPPAAEGRLYRGYRLLLDRCLRRRVWVLGVVAWMVGIPVWLLPPEIGKRSQRVERQASGEVETRRDYRQWLTARDSLVASGLFDRHVTYIEEQQASGSLLERLAGRGTQLYNGVWGALGIARPVLFRLFGGASYYLFHDVTSRLDRSQHRGRLRETVEGFSLSVYLGMPHNAHISRMDGLLQGFEKQLLPFAPYVKGIITQTYGRDGLIQVLLKEEYRKTELPYVLYDQLAAYGANLGGVSYWVYGKDLDPAGRTLSGTVTRSLEIKGYNLRKVGEISEAVAGRLRERRSRRIRDIRLDYAYGPPSYEMLARIDHGKTAPLGIDHAGVIDEIQTRLDRGAPVGNLYVDRRQYPAAVVDTAGDRSDLRDLNQVLLNGHAARLGDVGEVRKQMARPAIRRENQRYLKEVGFTILGDWTYSRSVIEDLLDHTPVPYGYSLSDAWTWTGFSEKEERELALILLLSVMLVWMITAALFESWTRPLLVLIALPLALIGVGAGFFLSHAPFNQGGYASLLLLMGISVNNSILLVHQVSGALKAQPSSPREAVIGAASQRLRPIFITTFTTVAGFLPLLVQGDRSDIWYTLALGTSGGLISSSVLLVLVVPLLMLRRGPAGTARA